jgi:ribose/xylose/arabinose/galactoside ABC-type transport system permease subunit
MVPFLILALILLIFGVSTNGVLFSVRNLSNVLDQSFPAIVAGLGMMFVIAMGGTDIQTGSLLALSMILALKATENVGPWAIVPVTAGIGLLFGFVAGIINVRFKVPSFMVTLSLLIAIRAYVSVVVSVQNVMMPADVKHAIDTLPFKLITVAIIVIIVNYLFNGTRFGLYVKAIGENESAVRFAGVNVGRIKVCAFLISGLLAAIAGIYSVSRTGGVNYTYANGFELRVMMALFIGGIPVEGGFRTKIYKLIIGAPMIMLLETGLVLSGAGGSVTQLVRGLVLLGAVYFTSLMNKKFAEIDDDNRRRQTMERAPGGDGDV